MAILAAVHFTNLFWAVLIGWILSVVLHEFAHGLVAHWGGDYTIRERGGLTLNPFQYIDPLMSIVLPIVFLAMGGIPLPGGVTYIRRDLLRSRQWDTAVSLAGPAMNLLLFVACALPLHPKFGWVETGAEMTPGQLTLGALAVLQIISAVLNLMPIPPLDGYQAISPWLPEQTRQALSSPQKSLFLLIVFFIILSRFPFTSYVFEYVAQPLLGLMGFDESGQMSFYRSFYRVLWG